MARSRSPAYLLACLQRERDNAETTHRRYMREIERCIARIRITGTKRPATCHDHPERKALARGLCSQCYNRWYYVSVRKAAGDAR